MKQKALTPTRIYVEAKIIRADGTVEDLGVVADSDQNPNIIQRGVDWLTQRLS